jgi:hypothetical protein
MFLMMSTNSVLMHSTLNRSSVPSRDMVGTRICLSDGGKGILRISRTWHAGNRLTPARNLRALNQSSHLCLDHCVPQTIRTGEGVGRQLKPPRAEVLSVTAVPARNRRCDIISATTVMTGSRRRDRRVLQILSV